MLKHEDVSKLEELGWIEYKSPLYINVIHQKPQLSIEVNSVDMVYFDFTYSD